MNGTSAPLPRGECEMKATGLEAAPSRLVKPPRVAASPCALECKWLQTVRLTDVEGKALERYVVFGQAIGVYIDDRFIKNGRLDTAAMKPIARCGYDEYAVVETVFKMTRPQGRRLSTLHRRICVTAFRHCFHHNSATALYRCRRGVIIAATERTLVFEGRGPRTKRGPRRQSDTRTPRRAHPSARPSGSRSAAAARAALPISA